MKFPHELEALMRKTRKLAGQERERDDRWTRKTKD
jgi:hypothetical protein